MIRIYRRFRWSTLLLITLTVVGGVFMVLSFRLKSGHHVKSVPNALNNAEKAKVKQQLWDSIAAQSVGSERKEDKKYSKHPYTKPMTMDNQHLCEDGPVDIFIYFHSYHGNLARREYIRNTWLKNIVFKDIVIKYVFVLGRSRDEGQMDNIIDEFAIYQDTLVGDFIDDFRNLTTKSLSALRWMENYCHQAKYIVKLDDDICLNLALFVRNIVPKMKESKSKIYCHVKHNGQIVRQNDSRWYVPEKILPNSTSFPSHCVGFAVFFNRELSPVILSTAQSLPYLNVDDAMLFGLVPQKANIELIHLGSTVTFIDKPLENPLKLLTIGARDRSELERCWNYTLETIKLS